MVNELYWITTLVFAAVLGIGLFEELQHDKHLLTEKETAFRRLLTWVLFFCLQDSVWGYLGWMRPENPAWFWWSSTLFHLSTVATTFFWLKYVLVYLGDNIKRPALFLWPARFIIMVQLALLTANFFSPTIFFISAQGEYHTEAWRTLAFFNQYIVYLVAGAATLACSFGSKTEQKQRYRTVFVFTLSHIFFGCFQMLYPNAPFYSMGYFFGCFLIHTFLVMQDRNELQRLQYENSLRENEHRLHEETHRANTDVLTGIGNRYAYALAMEKYKTFPPENDFVYLAVDVNDLKQTNDSLGHEAGDELICGTVQCLKQAFGSCANIFRIGGDEFAVLAHYDRDKAEELRSSLYNAAERWHGKLVPKLSFAVGYAVSARHPELTLTELIKLADKEMYRAKEIHYANKGVDRRSQRNAYKAVCSSYEKILSVNLTTDSHNFIMTDESELTAKDGYNDKLSLWLQGFAEAGLVQAEDREYFLSQTRLETMRNHFASGRHELRIFYRRRGKDGFRPVMMELVQAENYTDENQSLYLFVKDIAQ